jgi:hypothetical protein
VQPNQLTTQTRRIIKEKIRSLFLLAIILLLVLVMHSIVHATSSPTSDPFCDEIKTKHDCYDCNDSPKEYCEKYGDRDKEFCEIIRCP